MKHDDFVKWFDSLKMAWEQKNPQLAADICGENIVWHETPFDKPLKTKADILNEWQAVLDQENIKVQYDIIAEKENQAIAHWHASFTRLPSQEQAELDGIFRIKLNDNGLCEEFHQWYNAK